MLEILCIDEKLAKVLTILSKARVALEKFSSKFFALKGNESNENDFSFSNWKLYRRSDSWTMTEKKWTSAAAK